jgi:hypothetical protein
MGNPIAVRSMQGHFRPDPGQVQEQSTEERRVTVGVPQDGKRTVEQ